MRRWTSVLLLFVLFGAATGAYAQGAGTLNGVVRDAASGEVLPAAHIVIEGTGYALACDDDGKFSLQLPVGKYLLMASYIGYIPFRQELSMIADSMTVMEIFLEPSSVLSAEAVITAAQRSQYVHLAPASIGLVTARQLRERQLATFDQAFDHVTGIEVTRSSGSNVQAFSIRGASEVAGGGVGNRVLLLIDGRPAISPESGGVLWNLVPMGAIDRVEVVKGAYSSLYGSSAMGGVVNVITRTPAVDPVNHVHVNYGRYNKPPRYSGYSRTGDFNTLAYSRSHATGKFSYLVDLARREDDGHREKTAYTLYNGFTKMRLDISPHRYVHLGVNLNKIRNDTPATWLGPLREYLVAEHRKDDYQDRREWNIDLQYHAISHADLKYSTRSYYYDNFSVYTFNDDPDNDSTNINTGRQDLDRAHVRAKRLGNVTQVERTYGRHHYVISGIDLKYDWIDGVPDTVLYGTHQAYSAGVYMQDEIQLQRITITAGIRYDYFNIRRQFSESNLSPKIAMVYPAGKKITVRTLIAQAFRNPSIAERFIKFEQGGGLRFIPNPTLRAEKLTFSAELGSRWKVTDRMEVDAAVFYNHYKDLISYEQVATPNQAFIFRVVNLSKAVMQGVECQVKYTWPEYLTFQAGYTFLDARDASPGRLNDALAYKVRHTVQASITGYFKVLTLNVSGRYRSAIDEVFIYPGSEPDANLLLHAKLSCTILGKHTVYAAVNNLTNTQYEELERYRMPGRQYTAGAIFAF
jgi:outer membrane receptor for ferrienterochelin and colicin